MIGRIAGTLLEKNPPEVLIDVGGIGYEIDVPMSTFYNLPALGESVALLTHLAIREDAHQLYGFASQAERAAFRELIKISGVGSRTALAVLSGMSVEELTRAVAMQESARLIKVPGIGKKTAERLLLELKGKLAPAMTAAGQAQPSDESADIVRALMALGYSEREAASAARQVPAGTAVADGIRSALKALVRS